MQKAERIICGAVKVGSFNGPLVVPVPIDKLWADAWNDRFVNTLPSDQELVSTEEFFITNLGRVVDGKEGMAIAMKANQLLDDVDTSKPLSSFKLRK